MPPLGGFLFVWACARITALLPLNAQGDSLMAAAPPGIGAPAPDFTLPSSTGENISLEDFKGRKNVVLFFYPKADTPG